MKRQPFVNRRYTKGVPFSWKMVYKRVRGWTSSPTRVQLTPLLTRVTKLHSCPRPLRLWKHSKKKTARPRSLWELIGKNTQWEFLLFNSLLSYHNDCSFPFHEINMVLKSCLLSKKINLPRPDDRSGVFRALSCCLRSTSVLHSPWR